MPGCSSPEITTRRLYNHWRYGTEVPDGFRHKRLPIEGAHSPESMRHIDGKRTVAAWQARLGGSPRIEHVLIDHGTKRRRRPDVTSTLGGIRLAFEIQVSPLGDLELIERTDDLRKRFNRRVVWLFAWPWVEVGLEEVPPMTTGVRHLIASGEDVWFLDPYAGEHGALARAYAEVEVGERSFRVRPRRGDIPRLEWRFIDGWLVTGEGQIRGVDEDDPWQDEPQLAAAQAAAEREAAAEQEERDAARAEADAEFAKERAERAAEHERQRERREQARADAARRAREHPGWVHIPAPPELPASLETACSRQLDTDYLIYGPPHTWKRPLALWLCAADGPEAVPLEDVVGFVASIHPGTNQQRAVEAFLRQLETAAWLRVGVTVRPSRRHALLMPEWAPTPAAQTLF